MYIWRRVHLDSTRFSVAFQSERITFILMGNWAEKRAYKYIWTSAGCPTEAPQAAAVVACSTSSHKLRSHVGS